MILWINSQTKSSIPSLLSLIKHKNKVCKSFQILRLPHFNAEINRLQKQISITKINYGTTPLNGSVINLSGFPNHFRTVLIPTSVSSKTTFQYTTPFDKSKSQPQPSRPTLFLNPNFFN